MQTVKQIIQDIAAHLPEQATFDDAMYARSWSIRHK